MKVLDVVQFYSPLSGGVKRFVHDKAMYLHRHGLEHVMVIPGPSNTIYTDPQTQSRVFVIRSPRLVGSSSYRMLISRRRLFDIIAAEKPDIIETGDPYAAAWNALRAGQALGIPVTAFYHSDYPRSLDRSISKYAGPLAARLFAGGIRRYLLALYSRMDATLVATDRFARKLRELDIPRIHRVSLGVDIETFCPKPYRETIRKKLNIPRDGYLMLCAGRLAREKNIRALLEMMALPWRGNRKAHLLLVGDGELRPLVQQAIRTNPRIHHQPYCTDSDKLARLYSAADLLIHAGEAETFGLVSIEAQACGTPVLAVREGGLDETLTGEPNLVMAASASPHDLLAAAQQMEQRPEDAASRQQRRERIIQTFSSECVFDQLTKRYFNLACQPVTQAIRKAAAGDQQDYELCNSCVYS